MYSSTLLNLVFVADPFEQSKGSQRGRPGVPEMNRKETPTAMDFPDLARVATTTTTLALRTHPTKGKEVLPAVPVRTPTSWRATVNWTALSPTLMGNFWLTIPTLD